MTQVTHTPCEHTATTSYDALADGQYQHLRNGLNELIAVRAQQLTATIATPETNDVIRLVRITGPVYESFLAGIDESIRQQYNCRTCATFFNGYGSLAFLTQDLEIIPLAFPTDEMEWLPLTGDVFKQAYTNVLDLFKTKQVTVVTTALLATMGDYLGTAERGGYNHFCQSDVINTRAFLESVAKDTTKSGHGYGPAETVQIHDAFQKYKALLIDKSFPIPKDRIRERDIYELDLCTRMTTDYLAVAGNMRSLWVIRYLMDLGLGVVHFKGSVVGALIDDLEDMSIEDAMNNYYGHTDPTKYKRKVALPTEREFEASVKFLNENDYTRKLQTRFATIEEAAEMLIWKPQAKTVDAFAALRAKVKTEEDAHKIVMPKEEISISGFGGVMAELLESGKLVGIAIKTQIVQYGTLTRNVEEDAGDIYVSGSLLHPIYMSEPSHLFRRHIQFDSSQADGLFATKSNSGKELYVLVFGNAQINIGIRPLNFVEELIPALRPHQRLIDTWADTTYLNAVNADNRALAATNAVITVPLIVNREAVISLITADVVQEFVITSER